MDKYPEGGLMTDWADLRPEVEVRGIEPSTKSLSIPRLHAAVKRRLSLHMLTNEVVVFRDCSDLNLEAFPQVGNR